MSYQGAVFVVTLLIFLTSSSVTSQCIQGKNCLAPNCRCWNAPTPPGGFHPADTPQTIIVSFTSALNESNVKYLASLFNNITNPNGCPALGTFFVQKLYSSPDSILDLHHKGHEIGVTSSEGTVPTNWTSSLNDMWEYLFHDVGLPLRDVGTVRAPHMEAGGDAQLFAMQFNILTYDSSCLTKDFMSNDTMLWPYTYDTIVGRPNCTIGKGPSKTVYPGMWQFLIPELEFDGHVCATPSACSPHLNSSDADDVFKLFDQNFMKHYEHKRTPFILELSPEWLSAPVHFEGTRRFMQHVRKSYNDTWLITHRQFIAWTYFPVPSSKTANYTYWGC